MKHFFPILIILLLNTIPLDAQVIESSPLDFYERKDTQTQRSLPLPYVRESDVVWKDMIWRTIDLKERFNQYMYFPLESKGIDGRKNFAFTIWDAIVNNEIEVFEDDELKIPKDNEEIIFRYTKPDTITLEVEDDEENYEYRTVLVPKEFTTEEILHLKIKEAWYIDKQTTEQMVRILALGLVQEQYKERDGEREYRGSVTLFWIPMLSENVRTLLARREAYYENNLAHLPNWEHIFHTRMFSSYIIRESNVFNRPIEEYLTGEDAIWESERIENELLDISQDMWEY